MLLCPWGFSRQEYWSGLPCPPPRDLSNPSIKSRSPALQADSLLSEPQGSIECPRENCFFFSDSRKSDCLVSLRRKVAPASFSLPTSKRREPIVGKLRSISHLRLFKILGDFPAISMWVSPLHTFLYFITFLSVSFHLIGNLAADLLMQLYSASVCVLLHDVEPQSS